MRREQKHFLTHSSFVVVIVVAPHPYLSLAALYNDQLLLWGSSGKHNLSVVLQDVIKLLRGQIF